MAATEKKNDLKKFIQDRHNVDAHESSFNDIYIPVKVPSSRQHKKTGRRSNETAKDDTGKDHKVEPGNGQPFYATDNGSFDDTVTSPGVDEASHAGAQDPAQQGREVRPARNPDQEEFLAEDQFDPAEEMDFQETSEQGQEGLQDQHHNPHHWNAHGGDISRPEVDGNNLGHMQGDSMPDTTSGRPSTNATDDGQGADMNDGANMEARIDTGAYTDDFGADVGGQAGDGVLPKARPLKESNHENQRRTNADGVPLEILNGFSFAAVQPAHSRRAPAGPQHSQEQSQQSAKGANNGPYIAPPAERLKQPQRQKVAESGNERGEVANQSLHRMPQDQSHQRKVKPQKASDSGPPVSQSRPAVPLLVQHRPAQKTQTHQPDPVPEVHRQSSTERRPAERRPAENQDRQDPRPSASVQGDRAEVEPGPLSLLDYTEEELAKKTYQDLKAASFDEDPKVKDTDRYSQYATLEEKMIAAAKMNTEDRISFFGSLTIDQWEDAGDWFLQRFGEIAKKFKDVRRDKRKAAQAFEDEIEKRQRAVSKKQEITQNAFDAMKQSGDRVLESTPRKKKTKK